MAEFQTNNDEAGEMTQIFIEWVMMQSQNTALCLGLINDPRYAQQPVNIPMAKVFIEQLAVIRERTQGNLKPDEQKVIDSALQEMEMAFRHVAARTEGYHPGESLVMDPEPGFDAPEAAPEPSVAAVPPPAPEPEPPKAAPEPPPQEESKKRFTKSYGA